MFLVSVYFGLSLAGTIRTDKMRLIRVTYPEYSICFLRRLTTAMTSTVLVISIGYLFLLLGTIVIYITILQC